MHRTTSRPVNHVPRRVSLGEGLGDLAVNGLLASHRSHAGGETLPSHEHGGAYLCVVLAGGYSQMAGDEIECTRGSIVAHPAGHVHANRFGIDVTRCVNLYFDPGWFDDRSLARLLSDYRRVRLDPRDCALVRLGEAVETRDAGSALSVAGAALELIGRAVRFADDAAPAWLRRVLEAIAADLPRPPALVTLAADAGVHPAHLCRSFRAAIGETIGAYSRRMRLESAYAMLAGPHSIAGIAAETGFYDQAHFARCFRRRYGAAPSMLRAQMAS